jgi:hypothetical protein
MKSGYLTLTTHRGHPGLVRARIQDTLPNLERQEDGSDIRYMARFKDTEAALMHVQNAMHTALIDLEDRIYRKPLIEMIACVEADILDHERVWIDPELDEKECGQIESLTKQRVKWHQRTDRIWQGVGFLALLLLLLTSL